MHKGRKSKAKTIEVYLVSYRSLEHPFRVGIVLATNKLIHNKNLDLRQRIKWVSNVDLNIMIKIKQRIGDYDYEIRKY
jgi:hypothetical protein